MTPSDFLKISSLLTHNQPVIIQIHMDLSKTIITTNRLKLIPLSMEYADNIFNEFTEEITTYMFPRSDKKIEETMKYINSMIPKIKKGEDLPLIILHKETEEFLGIGDVHELKTGTPELGIWLKKSAHGHKYGIEAMTALKEWIDKNIPYTYLKYPADKRNIPSRKIAESLGGIIKKEYKKPNQSGNILDEVEYWIYKT